MGKKINISKEFLEEEYVKKGRKTQDIADEFGCHSCTICEKLKKYGIKQRHSQKKYYITKKFLEERYLKEEKSCKKIAKEIGCNEEIVRLNLIMYGIDRRLGDFEKIYDIPEEFLRKEYVENKRSCKDMADEIGCSRVTVSDSLKKYDIKLREMGDRLTKKGKKSLLYHLRERFLLKDEDNKSINHPSYNKKHNSNSKRMMGETKIYNFNKKHNLDMGLIKREYIEGIMSSEEIGEIFGICDTTVRNRLKKENVKMKPIGFLSKSGRERTSEAGRLKIPYTRTEKTRKKVSDTKKRQWRDPVFVKEMMKKLLERPSSFEKKISELCIDNNLPFLYTGNGTFLIGHKNPDFINEEKRIAIEVFYSYFKIRTHGSVENYIKERSAYFLKYGYKTIFIDENEVLHKNWEEICLNKIKRVL